MELYYKGLLIGIGIGLLLDIIVIPIIQQLESVIVNALEVINGYSTLKVTKMNVAIRKLQEESNAEPIDTQCIGFEVPNVIYEEEEEEV